MVDLVTLLPPLPPEDDEVALAEPDLDPLVDAVLETEPLEELDEEPFTLDDEPLDVEEEDVTLLLLLLDVHPTG